MDIVQTLSRPTDVVPGYELLSVIGHGGMGVVYRAKQKTLDRSVAIKTILVGQMSDPQMAARFEQEARAVARLQHPNIIAAIDFGQHDGRLFFVMELVEGDDLQTFIEKQREPGAVGSVTESFAWGLIRQTASGLSHAAEQGIVHRDIKPANLLLIEPPAGFPLPAGMPLVKIADFGLAFLTANETEQKERLTAANTTVGSPHYIAPEQLSGKPVDARADIYALGATIFHLLAGQPPYSRWSRRRVVSSMAVGTLSLGAGGWVMRTFFGAGRRHEQARQQLVPSGWSEPLFNGKSLKSWRTLSGLWQLAQDEDRASILAGTNGVVSRKLLRIDEGSSRPLKHFAVPLAVVQEQPRVLKLVRDATHWFAYVDAQLLGALALAGQPELPEFRLLAEAGPAWISDVEVEELRAK